VRDGGEIEGWQFFKHSKSSEITVVKKIACDSRLN
jgi:hypothetical protein